MAHGKNAQKKFKAFNGAEYWGKRGFLRRASKVWMFPVCDCNKLTKRLTAKAERRQSKEIIEEEAKG